VFVELTWATGMVSAARIENLAETNPKVSTDVSLGTRPKLIELSVSK